jgi:hypothetical protein
MTGNRGSELVVSCDLGNYFCVAGHASAKSTRRSRFGGTICIPCGRDKDGVTLHVASLIGDRTILVSLQGLVAEALSKFGA